MFFDRAFFGNQIWPWIRGSITCHEHGGTITFKNTKKKLSSRTYFSTKNVTQLCPVSQESLVHILLFLWRFWSVSEPWSCPKHTQHIIFSVLPPPTMVWNIVIPQDKWLQWYTWSFSHLFQRVVKWLFQDIILLAVTESVSISLQQE